MSGELTAPEAKTLLERGEAIALDVREAYEWAQGHIAGALHVPLGELGQRLHEVPRDRRIVAVCRSGNRSAAVVQALGQAGYDILNLGGGLIAWHRHGLPLEPAPGTVA